MDSLVTEAPPDTKPPLKLPSSKEDWLVADSFFSENLVPSVHQATSAEEKNYILADGVYNYFATQLVSKCQLPECQLPKCQLPNMSTPKISTPKMSTFIFITDSSIGTHIGKTLATQYGVRQTIHRASRKQKDTKHDRRK